MTGTNATIAEKLRSYASVLSLEGANRFKLKAYRRAAETIEGLEEDVADLVKKGHDLTTLPGIGSAINASIIEIVQEGTLQRLERTLTRLSPEVVELASKPALDAKKIARIYKKLGIHSLAELKKNLDEGTIGKSLGARLEYHVRQGLDERPRSLLYDVEAVAEKIVDYIRRLKGVTRVAVAGSHTATGRDSRRSQFPGYRGNRGAHLSALCQIRCRIICRAPQPYRMCLQAFLRTADNTLLDASQ